MEGGEISHRGTEIKERELRATLALPQPRRGDKKVAPGVTGLCKCYQIQSVVSEPTDRVDEQFGVDPVADSSEGADPGWQAGEPTSEADQRAELAFNLSSALEESLAKCAAY